MSESSSSIPVKGFAYLKDLLDTHRMRTPGFDTVPTLPVSLLCLTQTLPGAHVNARITTLHVQDLQDGCIRYWQAQIGRSDVMAYGGGEMEPGKAERIERRSQRLQAEIRAECERRGIPVERTAFALPKDLVLLSGEYDLGEMLTADERAEAEGARR